MIENIPAGAAEQEAILRRRLIGVALGKQPAQLLLRVGRLLDVGTATWQENCEIAIANGRITFVGPIGSYQGTAQKVEDRLELSAIPGLGEVHKHIESTHLTPEYEAAMVVPHGNTWTCEASHEFSNVVPNKTIDFWEAASKAGCPRKIFILPGSAVPPTAWEHGAYLDGNDQRAMMAASNTVAGLDEVMDWNAVSDPMNPAHKRLWSMIEATWAGKGIVEGHGAGIRDLPNINAFAASGITSDHEAWTAQEAWDKLQRGLFLEIRVHTLDEIIKGLIDRGLKDWSQVALTTDDRSASDTLELGATDYNVRRAMAAGLPFETAVQMVTINPARHMRLHHLVAMLAPGRYADIVLLNDRQTFDIAEVWANGEQVSSGSQYLAKIPQIDWPDWARKTVNIGKKLDASDFAIKALDNRKTMTATLLRPFHWTKEPLYHELPVSNGQVQRDSDQAITKFSIIDRYSGQGGVARMFWKGCGPRDEETALACSMAHDKHNIWCVGSCDEAMALAVNTLAVMQGGWVLVHKGQVTAKVHYEIAGLMSARPAQELHDEMQALYRAGEKVDWLYEPSFHPRWQPGFPERLAFATLTCSPWHWNLVAPSDHAPQGLINVQTGETKPVVF